MSYNNMIIKPTAAEMENPYYNQLRVEYRQCMDEGLDVEKYKDLVWAVSNIENADDRARFAEMVFDLLMKAEIREGYEYNEPSDLAGIRTLRKPYVFEKKEPSHECLFGKVLGAWYGRICGCLLGKPVEGVKYDELTDFLKRSGNFPMTRYICRKDIDRKGIRTSCLAGEHPYVPWDDDTNYMVLAQMLIEKHGRDFEPKHMMALWAASQPLPS